MQGYEVQQSSASYPLLFLMISSTDHISPATGLSPTVTISKNGGAFASPSGAVTEIANGWYKVAGNATDTGTLGPLALHATASGADPTDMLFPVIALNPQSAAFGLSLAKTTNITGFNDIAATAIVSSGAITTSGGAVSTVTTVTNQLTAAAIATGVWQDSTAGDFTTAGSIGKGLFVSGAAPGASGGFQINGSNAGSVAYTSGITANITGNLSGSVGSVTGAVGSVTGSVASVTGAVGSVTGNVGGNVVGSTASVTAAVTLSLTQTLNAARATDSLTDTQITLNDVFHCATGSVSARVDASSGTSCVFSTAGSGTILRTKALTTTPTPTTVVDKAV